MYNKELGPSVSFSSLPCSKGTDIQVGASNQRHLFCSLNQELVTQRTKGTGEHLCFGEKGSRNNIQVVKAAAADTRSSAWFPELNLMRP